MPRKCKHENVTGRAWSKAYPRWYAEFKSTKELPAIADAIVCNSCGTWLPLGPSDETDERVAVEIRAAELAGPDYDYDRFDRAASNAENWGWHAQAVHPVIDACPTAEHEAGWLAREIATHGDEQ